MGDIITNRIALYLASLMDYIFYHGSVSLTKPHHVPFIVISFQVICSILNYIPHFLFGWIIFLFCWFQVVCVGMSDDNHLIVFAMENHVVQIYERAQPDVIVCSLHVHVLPKVLTLSPDKETLYVNGSRRNEVTRMHILRFHNVPSLERYIQAEW